MEPYKVNVYKCKLVREKSIKLDLVRDCTDVYRMAIDKLHLDECDTEYCYVLALNVKGEVTGIHMISMGDISSSIISPRSIFSRLLLNSAAGFILVHNHPSGDSTPSEEDIVATERVRKCGDLLGIKLVDHVIVGDTYTSLKAEGILA